VPNEGAYLTFPGKARWSWPNVGMPGRAMPVYLGSCDKLGIDVAHVKHRHGDSDLEIKGGPSVASRSTITAGSAVVRTIEAMLEKGRKLAAHVLEADEKDIAYRRGQFEVVGTDRAISLFELAAKLPR
jgi:carbon-monoxide dehydrogenase large subunit